MNFSFRRLLIELVVATGLLVLQYKLRNQRAGAMVRLRMSSVGAASAGLRILTANVQRLPFLFGRPAADVARMLRDHDLVCLQEDYQPWQTLHLAQHSGSIRNLLPANYCFPGGTWCTILSSGLSMWSRLPLRQVAFERFRDLHSVDRLADKGFLVVAVGGLLVVNTHLQATYDYRDVHYGVAQNQVRQILLWLRTHHRHRPAILVGDFNFDLPAAAARNTNPADRDPPLIQYAFPPTPTHWTRMDSVFETSSAVARHGFLPITCDGAIYENREGSRLGVSVDPASVRTLRYDPLTDHQAVSLVARLVHRPG